MPTAKREPLPVAKLPATPIQKAPTPVPNGSIATTGGGCENYGSK